MRRMLFVPLLLVRLWLLHGFLICQVGRSIIPVTQFPTLNRKYSACALVCFRSLYQRMAQTCFFRPFKLDVSPRSHGKPMVPNDSPTRPERNQTGGTGNAFPYR